MAIEAWPEDAPLRRFTSMAERLFSVPIAFVTFAGRRAGVGLELIASLRTLPFDSEVEKSESVFFVTDAAKDSRFRSHAAVTGPSKIRFCAIARLRVPEGGDDFRLWIMDRKPRKFTAGGAALLKDLMAIAHEAVVRESKKTLLVRRLSYGVSHDLDNMLSIIAGYANLVLDRLGEDDPIRKPLEQIRSYTGRAGALSEQLISFSGRRTKPDIVDCSELIGSIMKSVPEVLADNVRFSWDMQPDLGLVRVDGSHIREGILALATRARAAMPEGGELTITTRRTCHGEPLLDCHFVSQDDFIVMAVQDSGLDLDDQALEQLLEPFSQRDLAIPMLASHVREMGGDFHVVSQAGVGSTFEIFLPRLPEKTSGETGDRVWPRVGRTILVIDDDQGNLHLIAAYLRWIGYDVIESSGGKEALALAEAHAGPIHLVITDVTMSEISGPEIVVLLRATSPELAAIYMSGYTESELQNTGIIEPLGRTGFLSKPFNPAQLRAKVQEVLGKEAADEALR
jgi:two-component system, cell cycle sensor histidine kinase and response regulator CckA